MVGWQVAMGRHTFWTMLHWADQRFDLPLPPVTNTAIEIAQKQHADEVATAEAAHDKLTVGLS